jgi:methylmalonyl-CoA/ethylmalonyl-CoA epimerase
MDLNLPNTAIGLQFAQIAWVVNDIEATEKYFREVTGVPRFVRMENLRAEDLAGTYYGEPGQYTFHLSMAPVGEILLELIQPVSGKSIYRDFLDQHPTGGVQHIAYIVPEADLDQALAEFGDKGYSVVQTLALPIARVAYFDTSREIGVMTELVGVTAAGMAWVQQMKEGVV